MLWIRLWAAPEAFHVISMAVAGPAVGTAELHGDMRAPALAALLDHCVAGLQPRLGLGSGSPSQASLLASTGHSHALLPQGASSHERVLLLSAQGPPPSGYARVCRAAGSQMGDGYLCPPAVADSCLQLGAALAASIGPTTSPIQTLPHAGAPPSELRVPSAIGAYCVSSDGLARPSGGRQPSPSSSAPVAAAAVGEALPGGGALSSYRLHASGFAPALQLLDLVAAPIAAAPAAASMAAQAAAAKPHLLYQVVWQAAVACAWSAQARARACPRRLRADVQWACVSDRASSETLNGRITSVPHSPGSHLAAGCLQDLGFLQANSPGHIGVVTMCLDTRGHPGQGFGPTPAHPGGTLHRCVGLGSWSSHQEPTGRAAGAWALARVAASEHPGLHISVTDNSRLAGAQRKWRPMDGDAFGTLLRSGVVMSPRLLCSHDSQGAPESLPKAELFAGGSGTVTVAGGLGGACALHSCHDWSEVAVMLQEREAQRVAGICARLLRFRQSAG